MMWKSDRQQVEEALVGDTCSCFKEKLTVTEHDVMVLGVDGSRLTHGWVGYCTSDVCVCQLHARLICVLVELLISSKCSPNMVCHYQRQTKSPWAAP